MRSIGRNTEFERVNRRLDEFRNRLRNRLHFAITAPPGGGLSLFLTDLAEARKTAGDVVFHTTLTDTRKIDSAFTGLATELAKASGQDTNQANAELETLFNLLTHFKAACPGKIAVAIFDVSAALRAMEADPQRSGARAIGDPLLRRLRTLVNWLQNREGPLAVIVGWDDHFLKFAPSARADDVLQRYSPMETLFADYGLGRGAWPHFRAIFEAAGITVTRDFPGICGSRFAAGAFVQAAKAKNVTQIDAEFLLNFLIERTSDEAKTAIASIDRVSLAELCLADKVLDTDPHLGTLVQLRAEGGYVASRELYERFGLTPPREIVSFAEGIRQRLEERDSGLASDIAKAIAIMLSDGEPHVTDYGWDLTLKQEFVPGPLRQMDAKLITSLNPQMDAGQLAEASAFIAAAEDDLTTASRKLLIALHHDPSFVGPLQRGVDSRLKEQGISQARPYDAVEHPMTGRPFAALIAIELDEDAVIAAAWKSRDPTRDDGLSSLVRDAISRHYGQLSKRHMPLLTAEPFGQDSIATLVNAENGFASLERKIGDSLVALGIAEKTATGEYAWRWSKDAFLERLRNDSPPSAKSLAAAFLFDPDDWTEIAAAIARAYTDDLVTWDGQVLRTTDPLPLLKNLIDRTENRARGTIDQFPSDERIGWLNKLEQCVIDKASALACEQGFEQLLTLESKMRVELDNRRANEQRIRADFEQELRKLDVEQTLPPDFQKERERLSKLDPITGLDQARDLGQRVEQWKFTTTQRKKRIDPIQRELDKIENELLPEKVKAIKTLMEDDQTPPEKVWAELEKQRLEVQLPPVKPPSQKTTKTEIFTNTDEDLARLADIYAQRRIVEVKIE
jgi:hypothetical protein